MKTIAALVVLAFAPAAHAVFKCVDEQGRTHIGETPPAACDKVPVTELSKSGYVLRRIDPTPTPEQQKVREEEARRKRDAEKAAAEQARQDKALLNTFASEKEFDVARDRNIEPFNGRIQGAQDRIREIDKRLVELDQQIETYKAGRSRKNAAQEVEVPPIFSSEQERLAREKHSLASSIAANEKEVRAQRERFDRDKKRWVELRSGVVSTPIAERK
jgi:hypothetical protein